AQLCAEGRRAIYKYCEARPGVRHSKCGKLIVANGTGEVGRLEEFFLKATENGVENLRMLGAPEVRRMEPNVEAEAALYSPESGIVSVADLVREFLREVGRSRLELGKEVRRVRREATGLYVEFGESEVIRCDYLINCAGLAAQQVALSIDDFPTDQVPHLYPAKGNYCWLPGPSPFKHLVYPVPSDDGGLGVHTTLTLDDREILLGPDVEWPQDLGAADLRDYGSAAYEVPEAIRTKFLKLVARYYPGIKTRGEELRTKWAAFRPRLYGEDAADRWADFIVSTEDDHGVPGVVNLFGFESPGMTASLAIADHVVARIAVRVGKKVWGGREGSSHGLVPTDWNPQLGSHGLVSGGVTWR
ncbi:MAG: FAD-dependent oxidoreductase, partial [Planctomycetes bacterium]|nr:FAD-dependent oxidoreductase [Planctomycetota bacterium]